MLRRLLNIIIHLILYIVSYKAIIFNKSSYSAYNIIKKPHVIDQRQKYWFTVLGLRESIIFIHTINPFFCIKNSFIGFDFIYPESILYIKKLFNKNVKLQNILDDILNKKKILKHYTIDDPRSIKSYSAACKKNSVKLYMFMHARFNDTHQDIFDVTFSKYFVWSDYFKKLYLENSNLSLTHKVINIGHPYFYFKKNTFIKKIINILFVEEDLIDNKSYIEILKKITIKGNIFFKLKPGSNKDRSELNKYSKITDNQSLFNTIYSNKISIVIGFYSTVLFESYLANIPSIVIKNNTKYFKDFVIARHPYICSVNNINQFIQNFNMAANQKKIIRFKNKFWGKNRFTIAKLKSNF